MRGAFILNKLTKTALKLVSRYDADLKKQYARARKIEHVVQPNIWRVNSNVMDRIISLPGRDILVRTFSRDGAIAPVLLFFHGGGFVTGDFDSYGNVCADLANHTGHKVISVNYRLAPEHKFPAGAEDCYAVTQEILQHCRDWYQVSPEQVTLIGDSAGATLACVVSFLARDRKGILPNQQILIYPAAWCDYNENTPFHSVQENGTDYLLTLKKLQDYMDLYASSKDDRYDVRFAPLRNTDYSGLPRTLLMTMEFDPLRDEGEELGLRMKRAGTNTTIFRIHDGIHGIFRLSPLSSAINARIYRHICDFLNSHE